MFKAFPYLKLLSQTIFSGLLIDHREKVFNENLSDYIYNYGIPRKDNRTTILCWRCRNYISRIYLAKNSKKSSVIDDAFLTRLHTFSGSLRRFQNYYSSSRGYAYLLIDYLKYDSLNCTVMAMIAVLKKL